MTDPGYNLVEIVDAVRRAGNPQKAALEALAETDGLTDAALLNALGVERWGDLPTVPYPDAPGKAPDTPPYPGRQAGQAPQKAGASARQPAQAWPEGTDSHQDAARIRHLAGRFGPRPGQPGGVCLRLGRCPD